MRDIHSLITHLIDILRREEIQCDRLEATVQQERIAVRRLAIQQFAEINETRVNILQTLQALEEERSAVMGRLADDLKLDREKMSLSVVLSRVKTPDARLLDQRLENFAATIRRVRREIALNAMMIADFQNFLYRGLRVWQDAMGGDGLYSASGRVQTAGAAAAMVMQKG
ncbi:MAG: flagellar protein FlgN [Nitrospirota bacterium]